MTKMTQERHTPRSLAVRCGKWRPGVDALGRRAVRFPYLLNLVWPASL